MKCTLPFLLVAFVSLNATSTMANCLFNDPNAMLSDVRAEMESQKITPEKMTEFRNIMKLHKICPEDFARISAEAISFQKSGSKDTYSYQDSIQEFLQLKGMGDKATNLAMDMASTMKRLTQRRLGNLYVNKVANLSLPLKKKKEAIYIIFVARYYGNKLGIGEAGVAEIGKEVGPKAAKLKAFEDKKAAFHGAIIKKTNGIDSKLAVALAEAMARHNKIVGDAFSLKPAGAATPADAAF